MSDCKTCGDGTLEGVQEINSNSGRAPLHTVQPTVAPHVPTPPTPKPCVTQVQGRTFMSKSSCCGGGKGRCNAPGCCGNTQAASPQPFYAQAPCVLENHKECVVHDSYAPVLRVENQWTVPPCGQSSLLTIPGLSNVMIGSYLYGGVGIGFFEVMSFNKASCTVVVRNNCTPGNAPEGSIIPSGSLFIVTPYPTSNSSGGGSVSSLYPYLAADFTAPGVNMPIPITVTTTNGLSVGKMVQIGTGTYLIDSIGSGTTMIIRNTGSGAVAGTPVLAYNSSGQLQYPIVLTDSNPCTNSTITTGKLVACQNNTISPITGASSGSVFVLLNPATGEGEFKMLDVPTSSCTAISCCLTILNGVSDGYIVNVGSTANFTVGDILTIGTRSDRLHVTSIVDSNTLVGRLVPTPTATADVTPGTSLCAAGCCETLEKTIEDLVDSLPCLNYQNAGYDLRGDGIDFTEATTVTAGGSFVGNAVDVTVANSSSCRNMVKTLTLLARFAGRVNNSAWGGGTPNICELVRGFQISINGAPFTTFMTQREDIMNHPNDDIHTSREVSFYHNMVLAPGASQTVSIRPIVSVNSGSNASYTNLLAVGNIYGIGVSV